MIKRMNTKKFWIDKQVLVTGAHGFVGQHLTNGLKRLKPKKIISPTSKEADFRDKKVCDEFVKDVDIVIHLAAKVGGIGLNREIPGEMFYDNLMIGTQLLEASRINKVQKFVGIGTVCSYPKNPTVPFKEEDLWNGYPEETNAAYGLAKKMLLVQGQAYRQQYGFNAIHLLPTNMYGPGDDFDLKSSHVIPALIRKILAAKENGEKQITVWGTGSASREFLYVEDAAEAILMASELYNSPEPVNLGSHHEVTIKELVSILKKLLQFDGEINWDTTKPDGQPRRKLDTTNARIHFGFESHTNFEVGLKKTIDWYLQSRQE